ncbi:hypothetical protein E0493_22325 [Roseomonas sp. M0104]|uniref:Uncharacterized protein n=1 Tax=Teichococcus coralli TaxID=2545983 RepID=A0A845BGF6_9PROT|nr:hypothetical protein [Pseudoroseomonas coralli]MXP66085.1 hypothetical protein [Pseudoroseomonas coralli]
MAKRPPRPPAPETHALQHLAELAQRAADSGRVRRAVEAMVTDWLMDTPPAEHALIHECIADLHAALAEGVEAAQEQIDDLDRSDAAGQRQAQQSLAALQAARDALAAARLQLA